MKKFGKLFELLVVDVCAVHRHYVPLVQGRRLKHEGVVGGCRREPMSEDTPSLAWMTVCTLIPTFFFPVLGYLPAPLKIRFEKSVMVVESIICSLLIHFGVLRLRLSEKMCTFAHVIFNFVGTAKITQRAEFPN